MVLLLSQSPKCKPAGPRSSLLSHSISLLAFVAKSSVNRCQPCEFNMNAIFVTILVHLDAQVQLNLTHEKMKMPVEM